MRHRFLACLALLIAVGWLGVVAAQIPAAPANWTPPRTPWGAPDLQGVWNNSTTTPWERPRELALKEFYTAEEVAKRDGLRVTVNPGEPFPNDFADGNREAWYERGRTVRTRRTSLITDPLDGQLPPLTADAQKRREAFAATTRGSNGTDSWLDRSLNERCLQYRGLPPSPSGQNNNYLIVQAPDYVAIRQEHINEVRTIYTDGRPRTGIRQWYGESRGRWEGDTLVVETTNFYGYDRYYFRVNASIQVSDAYHIVERFRRVGPDLIDYTFTVTDPKTFTRPWSGSLPMTKLESVAALMFESACHEGNQAILNILTMARDAEKQAADEAASKAPR